MRNLIKRNQFFGLKVIPLISAYIRGGGLGEELGGIKTGEVRYFRPNTLTVAGLVSTFIFNILRSVYIDKVSQKLL